MKGKITISRNSKDVVVVTVHDKSSGLIITEAELTLENFAQALTGLARCECKLNFIPNKYGVERYGKRLEVKTELLPYPESYESEKRRAFIADQIKKANLLVDGWELNSDGIGSQQNGNLWAVTLERYVDK